MRAARRQLPATARARLGARRARSTLLAEPNLLGVSVADFNPDRDADGTTPPGSSRRSNRSSAARFTDRTSVATDAEVYRRFLLSRELVDVLRASRLSVSTGTVNHPDLLARLTPLRLDAVCTGSPHELRAASLAPPALAA
jgi:hypothetical protein